MDLAKDLIRTGSTSSGKLAAARLGPNTGTLRALLEEHHEKLRVMSFAIALLAALLVTSLVIKYSGAHLRRLHVPGYGGDGGGLEDGGVKATEKSSTSASSSAPGTGEPGALGGGNKYTNLLLASGEHTCCRLRTKCNNLCSYARSAYGGLSDKAYKSLNVSGDEKQLIKETTGDDEEGVKCEDLNTQKNEGFGPEECCHHRQTTGGGGPLEPATSPSPSTSSFKQLLNGFSIQQSASKLMSEFTALGNKENRHHNSLESQATISGTLKGSASPTGSNQSGQALCMNCNALSPTSRRHSSTSSSCKSLTIGGTSSQSAIINGCQWLNMEGDEEPIVSSNMDISAAHMILSYMEEHLKDKDRLDRDWGELCQYEADLNSTNCAQMSQNKVKNRNDKALAYDHSRVKLGSLNSSNPLAASGGTAAAAFNKGPTTNNNHATTTTTTTTTMSQGTTKRQQQQQQQQTSGKQANSNVGGSNVSGGALDGYINASFIYDHEPRRATHIITQSPIKETLADFWQMVWEQNVTVVVMLTRLNENGSTMCDCYWPSESCSQETFGDFEVTLVSEHICSADYLVRNICLKYRRSYETRTISQFHYLSWPNHSVPRDTKRFLEFRRKVNKCYRSSSSPIIVHCNDGTGRSGTYILIDMVLNRISKGAREIDIAATLEHLRDQRMGIVENKTQFEFVLGAVAEEIQAILKALPQ